jgi:hypothetical protein
LAPKTEWDPQYHNDIMSKSRLFHVRLGTPILNSF